MTHSPPPPPREFASSLAQPRRGAGALIPPAPPAPAGIPTLPVTARRGRVASVWLFGLLVLVLVWMVGYFLSALGPAASLIGLAVAVVPFAIVLVAVRLVDRWEPEPRSLVVFAIAWGGIAAVAFALLVDLVMSQAIGGAPTEGREVLRAVVQAPIVEEVGKGLGLLLLFVTARRAYDGPVDGVVYGALIGAGFALTENIQYFAISFIEGGAADLSTTFFVRGILSPFAHAMFTSLTGLALGLAARRGASFGGALGPWLLGLTGAILLHAFWNGSAVFGDFFQLYMTLQIPLFVIFILGVLALKREEARLTRNRLGDYAAAGWFTPQEVEMLATPGGRRTGLAWARTLTGDRTATMKAFIEDATALAAARQRGISGRDPRAADDERVLLARTAAARSALLMR